MIGAGLSLDQAPPFSVPVRFFLTAPLFGLAAAVVLLAQGPGAFASRWMPGTLAATHLLTLGVLTMVMAGALLQMLPVVAGSPVVRPRLVAGFVHATLTTGTVALATAFLLSRPLFFRVALVLLGTSLAAFLGAVSVSLAKAKSARATVGGMSLATASLAVTAVLGILLASGYGFGTSAGFAAARRIHPAWGLAGWTGLLVVGVAYEVVPMFQLTPPYPERVKALLAPGLFTCLALASFAPGEALRRASGLLAALGYVLFAALTGWLQARRRRRIPDVPLLFWRTALAALAAAALVWAALPFLPPRASDGAEIAFALLAVAGFAVSVIVGMLYRIVPFLAWFHLQGRFLRRAKVPHMRELLPEAPTRRHWRVHVAACALLLAAVWVPWLFHLAVALFALSQAMLAWNLWTTVGRYRAAALDAERSAAVAEGKGAGEQAGVPGAER